MEDELRSIMGKSTSTRIYSELLRFPESERQKVKDIFEGKEVVIEHNLRYGKIICRFIPMSANEKVIRDLKRELGEAPAVIYECASPKVKVVENRPRKKMKQGANALGLDHTVEPQPVKGLTFYERIGTLTPPYFF